MPSSTSTRGSSAARWSRLERVTRGRALRWAATAIVAILLVRFGRSLDWSETWRAIRHASVPVLLLAAAANLASLVARGTRWWIFLRAARAPSFSVAIRSAIAGSGLNNILPANGGEAVRVLMVSRWERIPSAAVLATVALDRAVELMSYVALLVALPLVVTLPAVLRERLTEAVLAIAGALVALVIATRWAVGQWAPPSAPPPPRAVLPPPIQGWRNRVGEYLAHFLSALHSLPTLRRLVPALALSFLSWAGQLATYHLTASAAGLPASLTASATAMLAVNLAFFVQLTPGNVGVFQFIYALVMSAFGLSRGAAIGVSLLLQALQIIPVTALALMLAPDLVLRRKTLAPELTERPDATKGRSAERP